MKPYYECHLTFYLPVKGSGDDLERLTGWKFSQIDGDPVLGKGIKSYLTKIYKHTETAGQVRSHIEKIKHQLESVFDIRSIREKIEVVIYDNRAQEVID